MKLTDADLNRILQTTRGEIAADDANIHRLYDELRSARTLMRGVANWMAELRCEDGWEDAEDVCSCDGCKERRRVIKKLRKACGEGK